MYPVWDSIVETSLRRPLAIFVLLIGCEAPERGVPTSQPTGSPSVRVALGEFEAAPAGTLVDGQLWIANSGTAPLDVAAVYIDGDTAFAVADSFWPFTLAPGAEHRLDLTFRPTGAGDPAFSGAVTVETNDPRQPSVAVPLGGARLDPDLQFSELSLVLGPTDMPCATSGVLELSNGGEAELSIDSLELSGDSAIHLPGLPEGSFKLAPGEVLSLDVLVDSVDVESMQARVTATPRGDAPARYADIEVVGTRAGWEHDTFEQHSSRHAMLVVVDRSPDTLDMEKALQSGLPAMIDALTLTAEDWSLGIVTADSGCVNGEVFTRDSPNLEQLALEAARGPGGQLTESLFELIDRATANSDRGECNEGLLEPGAPLHVLVVSDVDDGSGVEVSDALDSVYRRLRGPGLLTVSAAVDTTGSCAARGERYVEAQEATGGTTIDVCEEAWASELYQLPSWAAPHPLSAFPLTTEPRLDTVSVTINGVAASGWSWNQDAGELRFTSPPPPNSIIEVSYAHRDICE
ncbi:MAG: hypothetical protein ACI8PZ_002820 [Myxococcota bacterium]